MNIGDDVVEAVIVIVIVFELLVGVEVDSQAGPREQHSRSNLQALGIEDQSGRYYEILACSEKQVADACFV